MTCYSPLPAFLNPTGGKPLFSSPPHGAKRIDLPCGQCIGCRLERSRQWAVRIMHENKMHETSSFLTLTYNPENLPENGTLVIEHFQLFLKRYRKKISPTKIRMFYCGEYGENTNRPHYHAIIFGHSFSDQKLHSTRDGLKLYTSETLDKIWGLGNCTIGNVTFESAAYVARYCVKKVTGEQAKQHYTRFNLDTGEIFELKPEFAKMSLRPAIGKTFCDTYMREIYRNDLSGHSGVVMRAREMRPPRYYDQRFGSVAPEDLEHIKSTRLSNALKSLQDSSKIGRLQTKHKVKKLSVKQLIRPLE